MIKIGVLEGDGSESWTPRYDADELTRCLGIVRGCVYEFAGEPDRAERRKPAADFLYADGDGSLLAIEHMRLVVPAQAEMAQILKSDRQAKPVGRCELETQGLDSLRPIGGEFKGTIFTWNSALIEAALGSAIVTKLKRRQLANTEADERVLLVNSGILLPEATCFAATLDLEAHAVLGVDHAYLISDQASIWEIW